MGKTRLVRAIANHLRIVCANLGIRLLHSKPGRPWSRGKVERTFRTLQQDFEARLDLLVRATAGVPRSVCLLPRAD